MKIKSQIIQEEIPTENIDELEQTLKDIGFEEQKIRNIIDPLKKQVETTTTPEEPPTPGVPEEPKTGPEQSKHVLQPGMVMKRLQSNDSVDDLFEEKVEEYLDQGEEFDTAVHKAHKHLERVVDYLELHGQRELKGPAKGKVFGNSLYDRLSDIFITLEQFSGDNEGYNNARRDFDNLYDDLIADLDHVIFDETAEQQTIEKSLDWKAKVEQLGQLKEDIEDALLRRAGDMEVDISELGEIVAEVKEVGLSTIQGTTSPIDLGEWLY